MRSVYKLNSWWNYKENYNYAYFKKIFGNTIASEVDLVTIAENYNEVKLICVRDEISCNKLNYINNITNNSQGIGSGAGYIELDNGTYTLCNEVNGELVPIESINKLLLKIK